MLEVAKLKSIQDLRFQPQLLDFIVINNYTYNTYQLLVRDVSKTLANI